ncbi:MAG: GIY-YIG nuclease family protein [Timaviella obliquedivisa GSE-PSE-MK23-08B]|nr:GIY-YIG nuclease family protein [Timaviella obliquedivisa GSE-PSE-MK23-08B]
MNTGEQPSLFADDDLKRTSFRYQDQPGLWMSQGTLSQWKVRVAEYQDEVRFSPIEEQGLLFDIVASTVKAEAIDPFSLYLYNFFFFEQPAHKHPDQPSLYFVIDVQVPLLLYVGETVKANQRWKGIHDCKRYVLNYRDLHAKYGIETAINTAFYWDIPAEVRPRQQLESALIERWRSPFNKQNWNFWGTPFVGGKMT